MAALPTLYKRTSTGKIQQWTIIVDGSSYYTESGQTTGKITKSKPTLCSGKNIGKSNQTTSQQQAEAEAEAKWNKKCNEGYAETIEESNDKRDERIEPMLAQKWDDVLGTKNDVVYPCISQPKLDGIRCLVTRDAMMSRKWKPIVACPHILESLKEFFDMHPDVLALDGELYNHVFHDEFHEIVSLVRKTKPTENDLQRSADLIEYHVYDVIRQSDDVNLARDLFLSTTLRGDRKSVM